MKFVNHINKIIVFDKKCSHHRVDIIPYEIDKRSKSSRRVHSLVQVHTNCIVVLDLLVE